MAQSSIPDNYLSTQSVGSFQFSCIACRQRKVKCDRRDPCSNCAKTSKVCQFVQPVRGKRKRTKPPKEGLHARLKRYEELLKASGANIELSGSVSGNGDSSDDDADATSRSNVGMSEDSASPTVCISRPSPLDQAEVEMIRKGGESRYFDSNVWSSMGPELKNPDDNDILMSMRNAIRGRCGPEGDLSPNGISNPDWGEQSLILGAPPKIQDLATLHPPLATVRKLYDIFLDRVDPMVKLLHTPSFWVSLENVVKNPKNVSKSLEALVFAVYAATLSAMEEEECQQLMNDQKSILFERYRRASHYTLINAEFIRSSSLTTLQAYMFYLLGAKGVYQNDSLFILSGIAVRLARRMGLHRDGASLGIPPFETEMRRRLWWQIVHTDSRSSNFSGTKTSMDLALSDTKPVLNVFDEDLSPDMTEFPPERHCITSCVIIRLVCDISAFLIRITPPNDPFSFHWESLTSPSLTVDEKEEEIKKLEELIETKYIRRCDVTVPLHFFVSLIARTGIAKMRLFAHNPRQFAERGIKVPESSREIIWKSAVKLLQSANFMYSSETLRRFSWQVGTAYLWDTMLYVLIEIRERKMGPEVERMWELLSCVFDNYTEMLQDTNSTLYAALGFWTLHVYDDCVVAQKEAGIPETSEPDFIAAIRRCRKSQTQTSVNDQSQVDNGKAPGNRNPTEDASQSQTLGIDETQINDFDFLEAQDYSNLLSFNLEPNEWAQLERLLYVQGN